MELDRLELGEDSSGSVMPLVLCRSKGGPYDDDAFSRCVMTAVDLSPVMVPAPVVVARMLHVHRCPGEHGVAGRPAPAASPRVRMRELAVDSLAPTSRRMER